MEGTPQGSPLSPILSNVMLDDLDRELWGRGHRFVRYADDLRVFVRSERAAQQGVRERLRRDRTAAEAEGEPGEVLDPARRAGDAAGVRVLLRRPAGICPQGDPAAEGPAAEADPAALERVDGLPHRQAQPVHHRGWVAYFRLAERVSVLGKLDGWLRRRLRQVR